MNKSLSLLSFGFLSLLALLIGLYPMSYLLNQGGIGFLGTKGALLENSLWNIAFYAHIIGGGICLLVGWSQFWKRLRLRNISLHRNLGKIYLVSILLFSAPGGIYIAFYANGGFANALGFGMLGVLWFYTTLQAYLSIRKKRSKHIRIG